MALRAVQFSVDFDKRMWYLVCNVDTKALPDLTLGGTRENITISGCQSAVRIPS